MVNLGFILALGKLSPSLDIVKLELEITNSNFKNKPSSIQFFNNVGDFGACALAEALKHDNRKVTVSV